MLQYAVWKYDTWKDAPYLVGPPVEFVIIITRITVLSVNVDYGGGKDKGHQKELHFDQKERITLLRLRSLWRKKNQVLMFNESK